MGDFPNDWELARPLVEGGQAHTFVVRNAAHPEKLFVLKRLKNPKRSDYFEREIRACAELSHPNVLKIVKYGTTPAGRPYLITDYYSDGALSESPAIHRPLVGLELFQQIVDGVAYAHARKVSHLDLKPANILLNGNAAIVGDFGLCWIEDEELSFSSEGPRGSLHYCAPELRNPKIEENVRLDLADIYSLGKILYWVFTKAVYDGHEEDYSNNEKRRLARLFPSDPEFAFIDEVIAESVRRNPSERLADITQLSNRVKGIGARIQARGRVLDLRIPQRCLYCGQGQYRAAHEFAVTMREFEASQRFPDLDRRRNPHDPTQLHQPQIYRSLNDVARPIIGLRENPTWIPLLLVCDFCGNVQYFRLDLTKDKHGENWRP